MGLSLFSFSFLFYRYIRRDAAHLLTTGHYRTIHKQLQTNITSFYVLIHQGVVSVNLEREKNRNKDIYPMITDHDNSIYLIY